MKTYTTPGGSVPRLFLDILDQTHTLIAGTTGSGKSVLLNGIIYTALHFAPPEKQFILIDPKRIDLKKYAKLPHTILHAKDPREITSALKYAERLMDKRYAELERTDLDMYNGSDIYIFIDELGDVLSDQNRRDNLPILSRLARLGRAARIHIIGGTQCPNRKTLSAEFAANCPARVGLRCREGIESRQIIGNNSAVALPEYGTGIYLTPKTVTQVYVDIPYIQTDEVNRLISYWKPRR